MSWEIVDELMAEAAAPCSEQALPGLQKRKHVFPGAVLLAGHKGEVQYLKAFGCRSVVPEVAPLDISTVYDVASLTKVLVTTSLVMKLVERGQLDIDYKLSRVFQTFGTHGKTGMTIRHLLTHSSGYAATTPYYKQISKLDKGSRAGVMTSRSACDIVYQEIFRAPLENLPGRAAKYSDLGFILLGHVVEVANGGKSLDRLAQDEIIGPLELVNTGFVDLSKLRRRGLIPVSDMIAPTTKCSWRGKVLLGEVNDENAWAMGGVAGHAGLFSNAEDIHRFASELLAVYHGRSRFIEPGVLRRFWTLEGSVPGSTWALGWDTPSPTKSSSGSFFGPRSVGHLGFTGCSLWIDPEKEVDVILLSNRVHPSTDNTLIREFRPKIHNAVMTALGFGGS